LRSNEGYEEVVKDGTMSLFKNLNKAEWQQVVNWAINSVVTR
jgi:hypothetical protein